MNSPVNYVDPWGMNTSSPTVSTNSGGYLSSAAQDFSRGYSESGQYRSIMEPAPSFAEQAGNFVGQVATAAYNMIPGATMMDQATANYQAGNIGTAALFAVGSIVDAGIGVASLGESSALRASKGIGFAKGTAQSAFTPNRLQHASRHLTESGILPNWSKATEQKFTEMGSRILENPTATFNHTLRGG